MKHFTAVQLLTRCYSGIHLSCLVRLCTLSLALLFCCPPTRAAEPAPPQVMLANVFRGNIPLADYWVSEKFDGMRGYWDGEKLLTRSGEHIEAPAWFTTGWPNIPLDGELWIGHGQFSRTVSTVRKKIPDDAQWRMLHFMIFDLPAHPGGYTERNAALQSVITQIGQPWVHHVEQIKVADQVALKVMLKRVVKQGGEGLMLHRGTSLYRAIRSDDLLKLKPYEDAEAKVVAYLPGKGKYANTLGALEVESADGLRFRLGTGLSDEDRLHPPQLGSWVTYRYNGLNEKTGIPRFARFIRIRDEMAWSEQEVRP
ncbi:DNA ligase-1 [Candidatus Nitrotoga sp. BS]|uniref:DNA ligase n=1 Tax=Candidatus Nitrotoga sp. BS TaxID=2890408 RepID=UPI001EF21314|nr:DNA ligase [Candidatus Nitrotoga sp. BS]CAH1203233.1 DNA ligase-1 [Candidatus Nitrotoga sp. BS]